MYLLPSVNLITLRLKVGLLLGFSVVFVCFLFLMTLGCLHNTKRFQNLAFGRIVSFSKMFASPWNTWLQYLLQGLHMSL